MEDNVQDERIDLGSIALPYVKKHWKIILLLLIFALAFGLRMYHADYPVVGYHNWKEAHYLTEARNFADDGFFSNGFFVPAFDYPSYEGNQDGAHSDSFPTLSILLGFLFMIFGESLFLARFVVALFNAGTVIFLYLLVKELFNRGDLAFLSAFLFAINPLTVFFSHNVQLINMAIFFMVMGAYYFIKWKKEDKGKYLVLASLGLSLAILTKYTFALIGFPMLFLFPWERLKKVKENWKAWSISGGMFAFLGAWFLYSNYYLPSRLGSDPGAVSSRIFDFGVVFSSSFWSTVKLFLADNFTLLGMWFVLGGIVALLFFYKKRLGNRFLLYYLIGAVVWVFFVSGKLKGHSYHQYPLVPLFVILIAYFFVIVGANVASILNKFVKFSYSKQVYKYAVVLILIGLLWGPSVEAWDRQRNTQFYGLDVAGDYINARALPSERMFHSTHQSHGVLWHAGIKGYPIPNSIENLEKGEALGARWMLIYQWGFEIMDDPELWGMVKETYEPRQYAFLLNGEQAQPIYLLLEKGDGFTEEELNAKLQEGQPSIREYELSGGKLHMYYMSF